MAKESCWKKRPWWFRGKKPTVCKVKTVKIQSRKKVVCATLKREGIREGRMEAKEKKGEEEE